MKELAKHIEVLLLENDCVIVPGLGGFIAHSKQAEFKESANIFCPPQRTIGFNPQLVMNDGLLVQSYMQSYNTDFPDATRKVETVVSSIKESLYKNGQAELCNIGTLYYTMNGMYGFEPSSQSFFTPYLYGLGNFTLSPLSEIKSREVQNETTRITVHTIQHTEVQKVSESYKNNVIQRLLQHTVGIAAALILFFILSVPVENTYLDNASYASLGAETMLDAIRSKSVVINNSITDNNQQTKIVRTKNNVNTLKPVAVRSVKVDKEKNVSESVSSDNKSNETEPVVKQSSKKYSYIIVASLPTMKDAEKELAKYHEQGYKEAEIVSSAEHYRIALYGFSEKSRAYSKVNELRKNDQFKNAWVLNITK